MIRIALLTALPLLVAPSFVDHSTALADERPPCSQEADAVRNMKTRDPSLAYPKHPTAKAHLESAKRAFGVQQYDKAAGEYTAAGLVDEAPLILYNLGQTYREAKEYPKAIRQYELFLERGKPGSEVRELVKCHIATMKAELAHAASTAPPSGPAVDALPPQSGPTSVSGEAAPLQPQTGATADDQHSRELDRWTGKRKVAVALAAGSLLGLGAGTMFAVQNLGYKGDADRLCPSNPCADADEANRLSERADTRALLANVSFGVAAGLVAGAAVLWLAGAPSSADREKDQSAIVPQVTPAFAGVAFGGSF